MVNSCLNITIPKGFKSERIYLLDTVFKGFLGLEFSININTIQQYEIVLPNKNSLVIEDHFFSAFPDGLDYLKREHIPNNISYSNNPFTVEKNIPVIFGLPEVVVDNGIRKNIQSKIDIFSSIFFMLTRWEEYVIKDKDKYGRFPEKYALAIKYGINQRPVVDEYIEMLWKMLIFLGYEGERKINNFEAVLSHDVDQVIRFKNFLKLLRIIGGDIFLRKQPSLIPDSIKNYRDIKNRKKKDSFDTFDYLMDQSERIRVKSHFYFISQSRSDSSGSSLANFDFRYDIRSEYLNSVIELIKSRGHFLGIHGSYNSFNNIDLFNKELSRLRSIAGDINESRQHYLRFSPPTSWTIMDKVKIELDSTLGFVHNIGFRCGTSFPYHVYDFLERKQLDLVELPITVMDGAAITVSENTEDYFKKICFLIDVVKKYKGKFVLLWHTNSFNVSEWYPYQKYYSKIIDYLGSMTNDL